MHATVSASEKKQHTRTLIETHTWSHFCQTKAHRHKPRADILNHQETLYRSFNRGVLAARRAERRGFLLHPRGSWMRVDRLPGSEGWHARSSGTSGLHATLFVSRRKTLCCCCSCCCVCGLLLFFLNPVWLSCKIRSGFWFWSWWI